MYLCSVKVIIIMEENKNDFGEIVIFNGEDGDVNVQIDAVNETIWLTQKGMAQLFGVGIPAISKHLSNIYEEGELEQNATVSKMEIVQKEGEREVRRTAVFYNLDAVVSVGFRVNSKRATKFRIWANRTLKEYLVKGYVLDDKRFTKGQSLTYFKELLGRIRKIRISERVFYQQIKDIYRLSADYDKDDEKTIKFFAAIQNKLIWAVSGHTAAELIYMRANAELPMMGLTSTEDEGVVKASDVGVGKNYLNEEEIENLKYIVDQYLSFAEAQAYNHVPMMMDDWEKSLNVILTMNRKDILETKGTVRMELAKKRARLVYKEYKEKMKDQERIESLKELDEDIKRMKRNRKNPPEQL